MMIKPMKVLIGLIGILILAYCNQNPYIIVIYIYICIFIQQIARDLVTAKETCFFVVSLFFYLGVGVDL